MKVYIDSTCKEKEVSVEIHCEKEDSNIRRLEHYISLYDEVIAGRKGVEVININVKDVLYFEAVDNKVFIYTSDNVMESNKKLYELESSLDAGDFFRCSKSMIVNINKIAKIKPELTRNIVATMSNGEMITISRRYVKAFKELINIV